MKSNKSIECLLRAHFIYCESTNGQLSHVGGQTGKLTGGGKKQPVFYFSANLSLVEKQNIIFDINKRLLVVLLLCLSTLPPVCLSEKYDECSRQVELAAALAPILSHPSARSVFLLHSPTPLLLSHTSRPSPCIQPASLPHFYSSLTQLLRVTA